MLSVNHIIIKYITYYIIYFKFVVLAIQNMEVSTVRFSNRWRGGRRRGVGGRAGGGSSETLERQARGRGAG